MLGLGIQVPNTQGVNWHVYKVTYMYEPWEPIRLVPDVNQALVPTILEE